MTDQVDGETNQATCDQLIATLRGAFGPCAGISAATIDGELPVLAGEAQYIARANAQRRAEFSHGRHCARRALAPFGLSDFPILRNAFGAPCWPEGITGSICHERPWAVAVAMHSLSNESIGIDLLDRQQRIDADVAAQFISRNDRWSDLVELHSLRGWQTLFSAKEAVVKAISPRLQRFVELTDITIHGDGPDFLAAYHGISGSLVGKVHEVGGLVLTTAVFTPAT